MRIFCCCGSQKAALESLELTRQLREREEAERRAKEADDSNGSPAAPPLAADGDASAGALSPIRESSSEDESVEGSNGIDPSGVAVDAESIHRAAADAEVISGGAAEDVDAPSFLEAAPSMSAEIISRLTRYACDLAALNEAALEQLEASTKVFQAIKALDEGSEPAPNFADIAQLLATCDDEHFHEKVLDTLAEKMGIASRDELPTHFNEVEFTTHLRASFFQCLDTWAVEKYGIDLDDFDGSIYTLLPPHEKRDDVPDLGKQKRHDLLERWFQALDLTIAKRDSVPLPEKLGVAAPHSPPLDLGDIPIELTHSGAALKGFFPFINGMLRCVLDPLSTNRDFHLRIAALTARMTTPFIANEIETRFAEKMKISREDAKRLYTFAECRPLLEQAVSEAIDEYFIRHGWVTRDEISWMESALTARARALIATNPANETFQELRGAMDANETWMHEHHFSKYLPHGFYFETLFAAMKAKRAAA